tara:strand:+ start:207 stop:515 length:309 start_codon:yes stop_codon:yes gene_type:complete
MKKPSEKRLKHANLFFDNKPVLEIMQQMVTKLTHRQPGKTVTQCRKQLKNTHIHILDYVEGNYQKTFNSVGQLRHYIKTSLGPFPLQEAKSKGLKGLLRQLY